VIFQEKPLKVLKCYNLLRKQQQQHNYSPVVSFANSVMTFYLLKVHLQMFLSIPVTQKCQILSCDTLVANERYICSCCAMNAWLSVQMKQCAIILQPQIPAVTRLGVSD
jgi:hypothetical protein